MTTTTTTIEVVNSRLAAIDRVTTEMWELFEYWEELALPGFTYNDVIFSDTSVKCITIIGSTTRVCRSKTEVRYALTQMSSITGLTRLVTTLKKIRVRLYIENSKTAYDAILPNNKGNEIDNEDDDLTPVINMFTSN